MAQIYTSLLNPIRFKSGNGTDYFPTLDKMNMRYQNQRGITSNPYLYHDWLLGEQIEIEIRTEIEAVSQYTGIFMRCQTPSGIVEMTRVDITPIGWLGGDFIYRYRYTPTEEGLHSIYSAYTPSVEYQVLTDQFLVKENDGDLVEIKYSDTKNSHGGIFYDVSGTQRWQPKTYFTGYFEPTTPKNTYSIYEDDPGVIFKLNAEPQRMIKLVLTDISKLYKDMINYIFSCNTIYINDMPVQNQEPPEWNDTEKSDMCDCTINLMLVDNDNFIKNH